MHDEPPDARPDARHSEETEGRGVRKQREIKDDGRYIIYYTFEDVAGDEGGPGS